jgi:hypothetical protein
VIAPPDPCRSIRRGQQRRYLLSVKERHAPLHVSFVRHRENALAMKKPARVGHCDVAEERADGGKTRIAGAGRVAARRFHIDQEVGDKIGVEILDRQLRGRLSTP